MPITNLQNIYCLLIHHLSREETRRQRNHTSVSVLVDAEKISHPGGQKKGYFCPFMFIPKTVVEKARLF